jgi:hypothetical protein
MVLGNTQSIKQWHLAVAGAVKAPLFPPASSTSHMGGPNSCLAKSFQNPHMLIVLLMWCCAGRCTFKTCCSWAAAAWANTATMLTHM